MEPLADAVSRMDRLSPQHQAQSQSRDRALVEHVSAVEEKLLIGA